MSDELLRQILDRLEAIEAQLNGRRLLSETERAALERLLPALAGRFGSDVFTTRDVLSDVVLRSLVSANGNASQMLGNLFRKAVGVEIDGLMVRRVGQQSHAVLWTIVRKRSLQAP